MADTPQRGWHLSDNGLKAITLLVGAIVSLGTLWLQSHNQHVDRMEIEQKKIDQLKAIEVKLDSRRPPVFGGE